MLGWGYRDVSAAIIFTTENPLISQANGSTEVLSADAGPAFP